ncbi:hypothetical protein B566_EDAN010776 [Ephemera danica]|nr:hypothetical protein B566_EDAN010776 [Ephemera danica]
MAITHRTFVLLIFPMCSASIAILVTCLATHNWFQATSIYSNEIDEINYINYGLFAGTHQKTLPGLTSPKSYDLFMTCIASEGVCALSCLGTSEERKKQLQDLLNNDTDVANFCDIVSSLIGQPRGSYYHYEMEINLLANAESKAFDPPGTYISYGLWVTTIVFISLSILMASVAALFAVVNTAGNPVEPILGIFGLYIWNTASAVLITITMIIWGIQFGVTLVDNAVVFETITGECSSEGRGALGYSYWLLLVSIFIHLGCIGMLQYRRFLIRTAPPAPTIRMEEDPDGAIFLY